jgi:hypothetical protein
MRRFNLVWLVLFLLASPFAFAGPPFQTDDPEPVPFHHYEAYAFGITDRASDGTFSQLPAFEFNYGAAPNLQLHIIVPGAYVTPDDNFGLGDIELGVKYRFVQEGKWRPQIGSFTMLEIPSGNGQKGLGNGQVWARLPVWIQKSFGKWTTYGGVGYQVNHAPGMKDSLFAGWLAQKQLNKKWTLGGEVYHQESQAIGARQTTFTDAGGYYFFTDNLQLLFMLGHTVTGERHTVGYLGLYYTWGNDKKGGSPDGNTPPSSFVRNLVNGLGGKGA